MSYIFIGKINLCGTDSLPGDGLFSSSISNNAMAICFLCFLMSREMVALHLRAKT